MIIVATRLLVAAAEASGEPISGFGGLTSYGGLGLLTLACLVAVRVMWNRLNTERDGHEAEARRLNGLILDLTASIRGEYAGTMAKTMEAMIQLNQVVNSMRERDRER